MQSFILNLLNMNHPHASIPNILNFMWCIWKSRNDCLFARRNSLPHHIHIAAKALTDQTTIVLHTSNQKQVDDQAHRQETSNQMPTQGHTLRTDLLIAGPKVYSDAAFRCKKIPGLLNGAAATGVGVFLNFFQGQTEVNVQIQASAPITNSPLQAEALALLLAAQVSNRLRISQPTFLTDCLSLAKAAADQKNLAASIPWTIRHTLADFFSLTRDLQAQVYHISREINGIAHNVAHQVLRSASEPDICCFASAHRNLSCPVVSLLSNFSFQGYVLHAVRCY